MPVQRMPLSVGRWARTLPNSDIEADGTLAAPGTALLNASSCADRNASSHPLTRVLVQSSTARSLNPEKSRTLAVTTISSLTWAIAAICPST